MNRLALVFRLACPALCAILFLTLCVIPANAQTYAYMSQFGSSGVANGQFNHPNDISFDVADNIYISDEGNNRVEKFNKSGVFQMGIGAGYNGVAGAIGSYGIGSGQMHGTTGVGVDMNSGSIYAVDNGNNRVQKFNSSGAFVLGIGAGYNGVAGAIGSSGMGNGQFTKPSNVMIDASGNVYVTDLNNRIEKFYSNGNYLSQFSSAGSGNGQLKTPYGISVDPFGNLWVADYSNNRLQKFSNSGVFILGVGSGYNGVPGVIGMAGTGNGQFNGPGRIAFDKAGNVFASDIKNNRVEKFTNNGTFIQSIGSFGSGNGQFNSPDGVGFDSAGNLYVVDNNNNRVQVFAPIFSISGILNFKGLTAQAAAQNVTFTFRLADGSPNNAQTLAVSPGGVYMLSNLPNKAGVLHIKPDRYLAVNVSVDLSDGNVSGIKANLQPGDANNDNSCDVSDFGILVGAYGSDTSVPGSGYDVTADFNGDGLVDVTDFGLLVGNYGDSGDL